MPAATSFGKLTQGVVADEGEDVELSPIHSSTARASTSAGKAKGGKNGYMSINSDRNTSSYQSVDLDTSTSPTTGSVTSSISPYHSHLHAAHLHTTNTTLPRRSHRSREEDEQEMVRIRIDLAERTPWMAFLTHPMSLCLLVANFQYVRLPYDCIATQNLSLIYMKLSLTSAGLDELHSYV